MDALIKLLSESIGLAIDAKAASDAEAEAAALAALDAKLAEVHPQVDVMKAQIAKDRAEVDEALRKKFDTSDEITKP